MPFSEGDKTGSLSFFHRKGEEERPQPAPGLAPGKIVGDFRLVALIGQGGMGQVWEAEQVSLRRTVAVKFVRPERVTERQLELFAREARAGGRLSHPGIVTVHNYGTSDGLAWIAMEFVSGAWTLRDFMDEIARAGEVPEGYDRHVARFVAEIADAMQAAHEAGVIHRDLKPQNVLIAPDETPRSPTSAWRASPTRPRCPRPATSRARTST
jgi:serine/threonine-protein kinase